MKDPNNQMLVDVQMGTEVMGLITAIGLPLALKIKGLLSSLGPDVTVNIKTYTTEATNANAQTVADVNAWLSAHGFAPLPAE